MESEMAKESSSFMLHSKSFTQRKFSNAQLSLRILVSAFALAAISVMLTSGQSVIVYGVEFNVHYYYSSAFKFFVGTNAVVCALSLLSFIFVYAFGHPGSNPRNHFFIFVHDMVITVLMISGNAAATAVGYVGFFGISQLGWVAVCDNVGKFCIKAVISIVLSFLAFIFLLLLTIMSVNELKHRVTEYEKIRNTRLVVDQS